MSIKKNVSAIFAFLSYLYIVGPLSKLAYTYFFCWRLHKYDLIEKISPYQYNILGNISSKQRTRTFLQSFYQSSFVICAIFTGKYNFSVVIKHIECKLLCTICLFPVCSHVILWELVFGFLIFWLWAYMTMVIPETCYVCNIWYIRFYYCHTHCDIISFWVKKCFIGFVFSFCLLVCLKSKIFTQHKNET